MSFVIHISDTHILPPGEVLYDTIDTAHNLRETVREINRMRPLPDVVVITGDLVDHGDSIAYQHFIELIKPLKMPTYVAPGNHDDPQTMLEIFKDTSHFPVSDDIYQYTVEDFPFRIIVLNSRSDDTELPGFDERRLTWLRHQLGQSDKPVLIAIHHPPMVTGIELIDMGGSEWFQGLKSLLAEHNQVRLVICGHCHTDLCGRIGQVPVYMAPATSHQLIGSRGLTIAPSAILKAGAPILHQFIEDDFVSGSSAWPVNVEDERIDKTSGLSWDVLKKNMMGSRA